MTRPAPAAAHDSQVAFEKVVVAFRQGRPALFVNEWRDLGVIGLPIAAATPEAVNFLITACRGMVYAALPAARLADLDIAPQPHSDRGPGHLHVPVDALRNVTTGISAADRARTLQALIDPATTGRDFRRPGHVVPMAVEAGGPLARPGIPETVQAAADGAGLGAGVVFCGVLTADGDMARSGDLRQVAAAHDLPVVTVTEAVRTARRTQGWNPETPPMTAALAVPHLDLRLQVRGNGLGTLRDELSVAVAPVCVAGHVLGGCECAAEVAEVRARLDGGQDGALAAVWPSHGVASCAEGPSPSVAAALADLVAAHTCGAMATAWPLAGRSAGPHRWSTLA
jgi:3,4-dihydroxy-2-butanone 4-phosphate synthase